MKTKRIAKAEEWLKEYAAENVQVVMLCASTGTTTDSTQSGGDGEDEELKPSSLNKSTGIYENSFSYNPFE